MKNNSLTHHGVCPKRINFPAFAVLLVLGACGTTRENADKQPANKIAFDLSLLNGDGLQGLPDGLRALHYEFCIPARQEFVYEVERIDTTLQMLINEGGRIRCGDDEYLCLGNTHQKNFRSVLMRLAELGYVERIEESFFEN